MTTQAPFHVAGRFTISECFDFSANHELRLLPETHKCAGNHGHNYVVTLTLTADQLDKQGSVTDSGDLAPFGDYLKTTFDHRLINDHPEPRARTGRAGELMGGQLEAHELRREPRPADAAVCPPWLVDAVRRRWGTDIGGKPIVGTVLVRQPSAYDFGRASYELNLGCNYDCEHCYLGLKRFEGLDWPERERLLHIMRDAGVLWLQLTGGEPTIDRLFPEVYTLAWNFGMMITVSSNGSRLHNSRILEMLTPRRPYRLTLSVYGATEASYDGLTRRRGATHA